MLRGRSRGGLSSRLGGLRGGLRNSGGSSGFDPSGGDGDPISRPLRRLPVSPIYEGGGPYSRSNIVQPPKVLRDRLYDKMCDWDFHGIADFDKWMPEREWIKAMMDLIAWGFSFDRSDRKIRLRKSLPNEPRQSVVDLLSGLTVPNRVGGLPDNSEQVRGAQEEDEQSPFAVDENEDIPDNERLILDEEATLVLSVLDYVTDTSGILARKGMGKTYLAMVIAEAFLQSELEIPFVVLDPMGCWYGLLATSDGKPVDHRITIFGGERGHYPLESTSGRLVASVVVTMRPMPIILDLSAFPREEQHRFAADFVDELYLRNRSALHVFIDEADIFAPQRLDRSSKHHGRCLTALDNLIRRGRFRGIGNTLISQRPAVINKNLLSQVGSMFFMQMIAPQDLDAVSDWLHSNIQDESKEECRADLPVLGKGTAYYLRGGEKFLLRRFKVKRKASFDSSFTPKLGDKFVVPQLAELSDVDKVALDRCYLKPVPAMVEGATAEPSVLGRAPVFEGDDGGEDGGNVENEGEPVFDDEEASDGDDDRAPCEDESGVE